ncbi:MAG: ATP-binding cassette domain-containing protein [Candidatus Peribacteraceae bacterium]|nr:ATP-binding cassette domain-containing protein [Candidatus Peribacteraceae bacterium]MDD5075066.1 ATP-binding cassette domain-containing protein [Candidatus Peribacteraceae bacterium]
MTAIIRADGVTRKFRDFTAVDHASFTVEHGEIFAFLGPNGAGKTTTIKMLTTLLHPTSGTIEIDGHNPVTEQNEVRKSFGIVFQDPSVDDELTAYENMELHGVLYGIPRKLRRDRIDQLLEIVELSDRRNSLMKEFSGGMKRRLEIARGLLHHPKVLFLDEPTIGLDPQTRNHLWAYVQKLNKEEGITVFLTTHYMEEADRVANTIAVIDHGRIIERGTSQELKERTKTASLEEAFLALTGHEIREEQLDAHDQFRNRMRQKRR